jgi:hypothetical protein
MERPQSLHAARASSSLDIPTEEERGRLKRRRQDTVRKCMIQTPYQGYLLTSYPISSLDAVPHPLAPTTAPADRGTDITTATTTATPPPHLYSLVPTPRLRRAPRRSIDDAGVMPSQTIPFVDELGSFRDRGRA